MNIDTYMYPASRERNKPFDEQSRMNPKDAAMAKKLIFQHQWGEEALREYQDYVISMVEDHPQNMQYLSLIHIYYNNESSNSQYYSFGQ